MKKHAEDKIGRDDIVAQLLSKIDNLPSNENKCVGLNGEWGSGKSWIMTELYEKIKDKNDYIVITYDAWKNNFYSDPLIAILYCIHDTLEKYAQNQNGISKVTAYRIKQAVKKTATDTCKKVLSSLFDKTIKPMTKTNFGLLITFAMEFIGEVIRQAKSSILDNKIFDEFKSYQKLLDDTIFVLNKLTEPDKDSHTRKLVILVDELDRCMPNEQLLVLERLHHLFEVNNCIVIVAFNEKQIHETLNQHHAIKNGSKYLEKFFNDPIIDLLSESEIFFSTSMQQILDDIFLEQKNTIIPASSFAVYRKYIFFLFSVGSHNHSDNRSVERYVSNVNTVLHSVNRQQLDGGYFLLILYLVYEKRYNTNNYNSIINSQPLQNIFQLYINNNGDGLIDTVWPDYSNSISSTGFPQFYDNNINLANLYFNMFLCRYHKKYESVIKMGFQPFVSAQNWSETTMTTIIDSINKL